MLPITSLKCFNQWIHERLLELNNEQLITIFSTTTQINFL